MPDPPVVGFRAEDGNPLVATNEAGQRLPSFRHGASRRYLAKTDDDGISALSGDTPGEGTVTIHWRNPQTGDVEPWLRNGSQVTVTIYSFVPVTSGTNRFVWIETDQFGTLWFCNEACP